MNDFFTKLSRRALNLAPLVRPVIPPMFAWEIRGLEQSQLNFEGQTGPVFPENQTKSLRARQLSDYSVSSPRELLGTEEHVKTVNNISLSGPPLQNDEKADLNTGSNSVQVNFSKQIRVEDPQYKNAIENEDDVTTILSSALPSYRNHRNYQNAALNTQYELVQSNSLKQDKSELPELLNMTSISEDTKVMTDYLLRSEVLKRHTIQPLVTKRQSRPLNIQQRLQNNVQNEPAKLERRAVTRETDTEIPTVRVSVGRIEIRAIVPPAPPQPSTKVERKNPTLTLNDYLKQRDGGKR